MFRILATTLLLAACTPSSSPTSHPPFEINERIVEEVVVQEVLHAGPYTYISYVVPDTSLAAPTTPRWMATLHSEPVLGSSVTITRYAEKKNFTSSRLSRTFPSIYFGRIHRDS